ncbi:hypothetical protein Gotri_000015 [Gossypium trilobum]|uniref:Uncharacterized protein n=1 Tax=Gossypium trilobum TaxID=34281 RepID=A0A7J9FTL4_9ROSI|nr:hypothetical protein [Gossypium trilobum]
MDRQVAIDMGKAIGEVVAIDWRDRDGGWTNYSRIRFKIDVLRPLRKVVHLVSSELGGSSQTRGNWRNGIKILEKMINPSEGINSDNDGDGEENYLTMLKGKEKSRAGEEEFEYCSPAEKHPTKSARDGGGKMSLQSRSGGLAMLWKEGVDVAIQNYSSHHIDSLVSMENHNNIRSVKDDWVMGGNFNTIINEAEKEGGRRKSRVTMEEFRDVIEELTLVDIKSDKGLFAWVNNREGNNMVKERLDTFLIFANAIDNFPFFVTNVKEARDIIKKAWSCNEMNIIEKLKKVMVELGRWQHGRYSRMKNQIRELVARIDKLIDVPSSDCNADMLITTYFKLGHLYAKEECYC